MTETKPCEAAPCPDPEDVAVEQARWLTGQWRLDPAHSTVQLAVRHMGVGMFRAQFGEMDGELTFPDDDAPDLATAVLNASAPVESLSLKGDMFRNHIIHGEQFFDAKNHPEVTIQADNIVVTPRGVLTAIGDLTVRGVTQAVGAAGDLTGPVFDPFGATRLGVQMVTTVDRRDWGMDWQAPLPGGAGEVLGWDVELSAHLELIRDE